MTDDLLSDPYRPASRGTRNTGDAGQWPPYLPEVISECNQRRETSVEYLSTIAYSPDA